MDEIQKGLNLQNNTINTERVVDKSQPETPFSITNNNRNDESKNMNKKLIRLTESDLHNIVRESVNRTLEEISEGSAFSHSNDEWGKDYFVNAKALARGIYDTLKAMEDEGNSNDYRSTTYLYHELERRVIELNQTYKLIKHYISGFKQPLAQP